jgi:hypothetical protein
VGGSKRGVTITAAACIATGSERPCLRCQHRICTQQPSSKRAPHRLSQKHSHATANTTIAIASTWQAQLYSSFKSQGKRPQMIKPAHACCGLQHLCSAQLNNSSRFGSIPKRLLIYSSCDCLPVLSACRSSAVIC